MRQPEGWQPIEAGRAQLGRWLAERRLIRTPGRRPAGAVLVALATVAASTAIPNRAAAEGVVMPYHCMVERGEVRVVRGPERFHRIIGNREQQTITICRGPRANACESLPVHRFALDCSGQPVPEVFVAAAGPHSQPWRASVIAGSMTLQFSRNGPLRDRTSDVILPLGFAPALSDGWRFIPTNSATADVPSTAALGVADAGARTTTGSGRPASEARSSSSLSTPGLQAAPRGGDEGANADRVAPLPPMGAGWSATVATREEVRLSWGLGALSVAGSPGLVAAVVLVALLLTATAVAARQRFAGRMAALASVQPSPEPEPVKRQPPPLPVAALQPPAAPSPTAAPPPPPPPPARAPTVAAIVDPALEPERAAWLQVAEMRATAAALLDLDRQIVADHVPEGPLRDVLIADLGAIAERLDGPDLAEALLAGRLDLVHPIYAQAIVDLERARTLARIEHERILEASGQWSRSLSTPEEACAFLGVNPRASDAVVKKVVDALRQNWHPDHAGDDADRLAREMRIKHINAAWDLIRKR